MQAVMAARAIARVLWEMARVAGAAMIGGLAGALLLAALLSAIKTQVGAEGEMHRTLMPPNLMSVLFFAFFTTPVALAAGIPGFYALRRFGRLGWRTLGMVGAIGAVGGAALLNLVATASFLIFGGAGFAAGVAAYAVLRCFGVALERPTAGKSTP